MSFPTIFDWLDYFSFLRGYSATWILLGTGVLIVLFLDWRLSLLALIVQYLVTSLLFFDLLIPQLAFIKLFVGMFVCLILYWTARQITYGRKVNLTGLPRPAKAENKLQIGSLSIPRVLAERSAAILGALLLVIVLEGGFSFSLPGLPPEMGYINRAILLLITLGTAAVITGRAPLPIGMGVLTFLSGFELYLAALDQTTRTLALLAALNFIVALAVSYITQRYYAHTAAAAANNG
ncbi:MAG: hypothetical protein AB8I52_15610 [Candidatus Promineifilaceae bacterium]|jgi:hypothetical protein